MVEESRKFLVVKELAQDREQSLKSIKKELGTQRRIERDEKKGRRIIAEIKRRRSVGARISGSINRGFAFGGAGLTKSLIARDTPRQQPSAASKRLTPTGGVRTGKRGRPRGSVKFTDPRTGRPIGVFEHRKIQAQQRRLEVIRARGQAAVTPRQQQVLRSIEERERRQSMSQERKVIPGTSGAVGIMGIMSEIDVAANLVS